jgi:hypothetical protein
MSEITKRIDNSFKINQSINRTIAEIDELKAELNTIKRWLGESLLNKNGFKPRKYIILEYEKFVLQKIAELEKQPLKTTNKSEPEFVTTGIFFKLLNHAKIQTPKTGETIEDFCKRLANEFGFKYSDAVRQSYGIIKPTSKQINKVKKQIFPLIDQSVSKAIDEYLQAK